MFETPIEKLRHALWVFTQDFSFIDEVPEDVIVEYANRLLNKFGTAAIQHDGVRSKVHQDLIDAMDEYVDYVLLNPSV